MGKTPDGVEVDLFTLTNSNGLRIKVMTYGATLISVETPDRHGRIEEITLSLDSLADYLKGHPCLGSTIGRVANRIAKGRFHLDGVEYKLAINNGPNHLHGGIKGFDKVVWKAEPMAAANAVAFRYHSRDGEENYPGNLDTEVIFSLTDDNELRLEYSATTDKPTFVNLTNHAYWNLAGRGVRDVLEHELTINGDRYLVTDSGLIPSGEIRSVKGTPVDFTQPTAVGARIEQAGGYDHCFVINTTKGQPGPTLAARVSEPHTGRVMEVYTTEPGVQLYTANGLDGSLHAGGRAYQKYFGLCLETQHFPDSPNHPEFPSTLLKPGEKYHQLTVHRFSTLGG